MIEVKKLNKKYGNLPVLKEIDLSVPHGEVLCIIGPSGSGKSTFIRTLNGLESFDSGEILIEGLSPTRPKDLQAIRREVGMVFQSFNLFPHLTVLQNITLAPIQVRSTPRETAETQALALLDQVGIRDQAHKLPAQLSGGQQQRVAIARALAMEPKVLLFDEPTSALDPQMTHEVLQVMRTLTRKGMTLLIVTHEMGFAREVANRILFFDQGQIVEQGPPEEFFRAPKTERAQVFLRQSRSS